MLAIAFRFPAGGRYHATAWGSHANEGVPEWPPSPWRLLRAMIATARWKHGGPTSEDPPRLRPLIEALATAPPPRYVLPSAAAAHTRHYMPLGDDSVSMVLSTGQSENPCSRHFRDQLRLLQANRYIRVALDGPGGPGGSELILSAAPG